MNILFDLGHPAHVHLFKNFIRYLKDNKHQISIVTRNKDITHKLLNHYELQFVCLSEPGTNLGSMLKELIFRDYKIFKLYSKKNFDMAIGTSVSIGHLSLFKNVKSYNFCEDDDDIIPIQSIIAYPFSTKIIIPECLRFKKWGKKRILHNSYHELAYLHPNNFEPDESVLVKYNLQKNNYIILRNSALTAHHDIGAKGINKSIWDKIYDIVKEYHLIYTAEGEQSHQIDPWDMHHLMAFSKMLISDSQSMTMEAAVLGIPNIRYNSFVGRINVLEELEHKYNLSCGFKPGEEGAMLNKLTEFLQNKILLNEWQERKEKMLSCKVDFNQWMIDFFNNEINTD